MIFFVYSKQSPYPERLFEGRKDVSLLTNAPSHRPRHQVHASINNANWPTDRCFLSRSYGPRQRRTNAKGERIAHLRHQDGVIGLGLLQRFH